MSLPVSIKEVPFFKLLIPFIAGIACQYWLDLLPFSWGNYFIILFILCLVFAGYFLSSRWRYRWSFGLFIYLFLFLIGAILTIRKPVNENFSINKSNKVIIHLLDKPQHRTKSIRVQADVEYILQNGIWRSVDEKMLLYFSLQDSLALDLEYGSILAAEIVPKPVSPSGNPYQFDFKKYLSDRGVGYTAYLKPDKWVLVGDEGNSLKRVALHLRDRLVLLFRASGLSGDELAVASALTLGYQDLLDDELRQVYSSSGAMHILSVSGLHVGILYVLLSFALRFLNKRSTTRIIKALILLSFLWFFALLTGIPPCVQRSALMFSFVVVGDCLSRKSNIYNTIAASAFILLAINPFALVDIGFQLSYIAVISIVFFYSYFYRLIVVKSKALDMVWSLVAVSIAAQLGTFSLCIYYFNQFPNYFLLSNLIAIPLSTVALYLSVLLIIVSPFSVLASFVGKIFSFSISALNHGLEYVENLPCSVAQGLHLTSLQLLLIIIITISLSIYFLSRRYIYLLLPFLCIVLFLGINLYSSAIASERSEVVVYNIPKKSLISLNSNRKLFFLDFDSSANEFNDKYNFFIKGYISNSGDPNHYEVLNPLIKGGSNKENNPFNVHSRKGFLFFYFNNKSFAIPYTDSLKKFRPDKTLMVDYLIINNHYSESILTFIKPKMVVVDPSVSNYKASSIVLDCNRNKIPIYIVSSKGAFVLN